MKFLFSKKSFQLAGTLLLVCASGSLLVSFAQSAPLAAIASRAVVEKPVYSGTLNGGIAVKLLDNIVPSKTANTPVKGSTESKLAQPRTAGCQFPFQVIIR